MKGNEKYQTEKVPPSGFSRFRSSGCLVETVVFMALMLDVMLMVAIDPILPSMLADIEGSKVVLSANEVTTVKYSYEMTTTPSDHQPHFKNEDAPIINSYLQMSDKSEFVNSTGLPNTSEQPQESKNTSHLELTGKVGILVAVKPATEIVANILVGCLVDRVGHRNPMLVGIVFNIVATVGFAYSHTYLLLMITRTLQAVGSSLSVVSGLALLATFYSDDEERSKANSRVFAGISIGIVLGYPYGTAIYQFLGREAPFLILAGLTLFDGFLRLIVSAPKNSKSNTEGNEGGLTILLTDGYILIALGCVFMPHFGLGVFLATAYAWMLDSLKAQLWQIGTVLAMAVIFHLIAQFVTGWLAVKYGRWKFCFVGMVLFSAGLALYPLCQNIWEAIGPEIIVRLGHGTIVCVISPLLSHLTDIRHNSQYGMVYGLYTAAYNLGLALGPVVGGFLTTIYPFSWVFWGTSSSIFLYSFLCFFLRNPRPKKSILMSEKDSI